MLKILITTPLLLAVKFGAANEEEAVGESNMQSNDVAQEYSFRSVCEPMPQCARDNNQNQIEVQFPWFINIVKKINGIHSGSKD